MGPHSHLTLPGATLPLRVLTRPGAATLAWGPRHQHRLQTSASAPGVLLLPRKPAPSDVECMVTGRSEAKLHSTSVTVSGAR